MSDQSKPARVSCRTVLIAAAGTVPLLALAATGAQAAKLAQGAVKYQDLPRTGNSATAANSSSRPILASMSPATSRRRDGARYG